ncbi:MAG: hypothetical protein COC19_01880 [SAR86 cluster bacterium]|uniref:Alkyl hydroperoxide reductase subunit C/ Thiol specific antioxidant domain-containing protein n=1 Tax=SAR86 cluster bacterium TaxID=2030880 RepID=A0A2A4MRZ2_9GAMM|nr:MAG: hypothetical protein COC19_01880 [SAR86 cluster bacterium]
MNILCHLKMSLIALGFTFIPLLASASERVGDFSLLDQHGVFHQMSWYDDHKLIALLVQANDSAATQKALPQFKALQARYDELGVEFMMINPMGKTNRAAVAQQLLDWNVHFPVLMDDAKVISQSLGINTTGEVLLFDPGSFTVEYRGPVSNAATAIEEVLAGQVVSAAIVASSTAIDVSYPTAQQHQRDGVSYEKDVAPILAQNCASCHREGGIAPFALDSHAMAQGWSPMIREVLMTKRMPPGQLDSHVGEFINDMLITDAEVQLIIHWADAGAPKDGTVDPLAQLSWPKTKWAFGEPDYIIKLPEQSVPPTGVLDYRQVSVPIDIPADRWVRGSQYIAGDRTVLHHTLNSLVEPGVSRRRGFLGGGNPDQANISAYIPGATPRLEPENTGGLLKAGSTLNLQLHYTTNGKETLDRSEIGLWFYPEGVVPENRMSGQCACIFPQTWTNITPNDPAFEQTQTITIPRDAYIHSLLSHMHFRGKSMRFFADYPDGSREELINIAKYNYNWQLSYTYKEPKFVPAGTTVTAVGVFDNSAQNPANPDPSRSVPWGQQSWDEMFFGSVRWQYVDQGGN